MEVDRYFEEKTIVGINPAIKPHLGISLKTTQISWRKCYSQAQESLGRKVMTNLDSIFKSRDITLPTKVRLVKAMVFPVVMYGFES